MVKGDESKIIDTKINLPSLTLEIFKAANLISIFAARSPCPYQ